MAHFNRELGCARTTKRKPMLVPTLAALQCSLNFATRRGLYLLSFVLALRAKDLVNVVWGSVELVRDGDDWAVRLLVSCLGWISVAALTDIFFQVGRSVCILVFPATILLSIRTSLPFSLSLAGSHGCSAALAARLSVSVCVSFQLSCLLTSWLPATSFCCSLQSVRRTWLS